MGQVRHGSSWRTLHGEDGGCLHCASRMSGSRKRNYQILIVVLLGMWSPSGMTRVSDGQDAIVRKGSETTPTSAATPATSAAPAADVAAAGPTPQDLADMTESQKRAQDLKTKASTLEMHLQGCFLEGDHSQIKAQVEACAESNLTTSNMCLESWSPAIKEVIPQLHLIGSAIGMASGMQQKCEQAGKGYQLLQGALTVYQAMCAGSQIQCKNRCKSLFQSLAQLEQQTQVQKASVTAHPAQVKECQLVEGKIKEISNLANQSVGACDKYKTQLAAAAIGGAQLILAMSQSKECEQQTSAKPNPDDKPDCNKTPTDPRCVDCSKAQYQNHQTCICMQNPRAQGCQGHQVVATPPNQGGNIGTPDPSTGGGGWLNPGGANDTLAGPASPNAGNGPLGGGFGGGGIGGGSGVLANQPMDKQKGIDGKSPSGPQMFESSGAGGLGRGGLLGRAGGLGDNPYSRFLPGGAEDPNKKDGDRALASVAGQITGKNGLSNFEKVKIRYQENRASLINQ